MLGIWTLSLSAKVVMFKEHSTSAQVRKDKGKWPWEMEEFKQKRWEGPKANPAYGTKASLY